MQDIDNENNQGEGIAERPSRVSALAFSAIVVVPMICTVIYGAVDPWALALQILLGALLLGVWTADSLFKGEIRFSRSPVQLPLIGLILVGVLQLIPLGVGKGTGVMVPGGVSSAISYDPFATGFAVTQLLAYLIFVSAALVFIDSPKRYRIAVVSVLIFTSLMAFFGILQFLAKPEAIYGLRPTPQAEPFSSYVNKHHFAALMEMTFGIALSLLVGRSTAGDKRFLIVTVLVLAGTACVLTGSRGGLVSLFAVTAFVLIAHFLLARKHDDREHDRVTRGTIFSRTFSALFIALGLAVALVGSVLLLGGDSSLIRGMGVTGQEDISSGRLHFWSVTWQVFLSHPILGVGLDSLGVAFTRFDTWSGVFRIEQAHNEYLQILAEAGVAGLICVLAFIVLLFNRSIRHIAMMTDLFPRGAAVGSLAGLFGVLLHSCFDFPLRTPANGYFFALLVVFSTASIRFHAPHRHHRRRHHRS